MKKLAAAAALSLSLAACSKSNTINTVNNTTINSFTQVVGPMGARIESPGGAIVDIPPGALTTDTEISIGEVVAPDPALPAGRTLRSRVYAMEPHGTTFALDVTLTLPHDAGDGAVTLLRASPGGTWQEVTILQRFTGRLQHETRSFSLFAVFSGGAANLCGNGSVDNGETCDDGNRTSGDGCSQSCQTEGSVVVDAGSDPGGPDPGGPPPGPAPGRVDAGTAESCEEPPVVMSSGTGTVLRDGGNWLTPVEGHATYVTTPVQAEFWSRLTIRLTGYPNACGLERASQVQAGGSELVVRMDTRTTNAMGAPLPGSGTYTYVDFGDEMLDVPAFRGADPNVINDTCQPGVTTQDTPVGQLVITSSAGGMLEGTYQFTGGDCCAEFSGTFSVPLLDCAPLDPNAEECCRAP